MTEVNNMHLLKYELLVAFGGIKQGENERYVDVSTNIG